MAIFSHDIKFYLAPVIINKVSNHMKSGCLASEAGICGANLEEARV